MPGASRGDSPFAVAADIVFHFRRRDPTRQMAYISQTIVMALVTVCCDASGSILGEQTMIASRRSGGILHGLSLEGPH